MQPSRRSSHVSVHSPLSAQVTSNSSCRCADGRDFFACGKAPALELGSCSRVVAVTMGAQRLTAARVSISSTYVATSITHLGENTTARTMCMCSTACRWCPASSAKAGCRKGSSTGMLDLQGACTRPCKRVLARALLLETMWRFFLQRTRAFFETHVLCTTRTHTLLTSFYGSS